MHCGLDMPTKSWAGQHFGDERRKAAKRRFDHRFRCPRRMQIDRCAERFGGLQYRPEKFVIEIATTLMAVDQSTGESLITKAMFELFSRAIRCLNWQRVQAGQSRRVLGDGVCQHIIGVASEYLCVANFQLLDTRRGQRNHLHVDAGGVHLGDAALAEVAQVAYQLLSPATELTSLFLEVTARAIEKVRCGEMLFKRDGAHGLDAPVLTARLA